MRRWGIELTEGHPDTSANKCKRKEIPNYEETHRCGRYRRSPVRHGSGVAHADSHHGSKGDRNARAFWEDTGRQVADPDNFATHICWVRSKGISQDTAMSYEWAGSALVASFIPLAEWHYCPEYLS